MLHRRGERRPDLARQAGDGGARLLAQRPVRQPHEPDPPAAQRHVLAQPGGHERAAGEALGGAGERVRVVGEVAVDLVGDDHQAGRVRDLEHLPQELGGGDGAGRIVGQRQHEDARPRAHALRLRQRGAQVRRVGDAARLLGDRHPDRALARERRVRAVADPARHRQHDVAREDLEERVEQRLAPGREDDLVRVRLEPASREVARRRLPRLRRARHRPVAVAPRAVGEPLRHRGQHRQPRLAEREVQDVLARRQLGLHALVRRERGRCTDESCAQHWSHWV